MYRRRKRGDDGGGAAMLTRMLVMVVAAVVFLGMFAHIMAGGAMFRPQASSYAEDAGEGFGFFTGADGTRLACFVAMERPEALTVVLFHGNAEDIGELMPQASTLRLQGFNVAAFDYRGYGLSEGEATEGNVYEDAGAFLDFLEATHGVDESKVVLLGRSLGGGPAIELARKRAVAGLIVESSFKSIYALFLPIRYIPGDKFRNERKIRSVTAPTLIIHGEQDEVVPIEHGRALAEAAGAARVETLWLRGAGHNDLAFVGGAAYWGTIRNFLGELSVEGSASEAASARE